MLQQVKYILLPVQAAGAQMAYQGAVHPDGTPIQGMPDGMQGRTMAWDTPADMMGPDGERHFRPPLSYVFGQAQLNPASIALACRGVLWDAGDISACGATVVR